MSGNVTIRVKVRGEEEVKELLEDMSQRTRNVRPIFDRAQRRLERANRENFTSSGLPVGGWKPLDAQYGAWKATKFPGVPTMVRSGRLFSSLTNLNNSAKSINNTTAEFGTTVEYAKFHQYGTTKMAKRKVLFEPPAFAKQTATDAARYIARGRF